VQRTFVPAIGSDRRAVDPYDTNSPLRCRKRAIFLISCWLHDRRADRVIGGAVLAFRARRIVRFMFSDERLRQSGSLLFETPRGRRRRFTRNRGYLYREPDRRLPGTSAQVNSRFINSAISPPVLCLKALGSRAGLFDHRNVKSNRLFHLRSKKLLPISYNPGPDGPPLFSEKIPEPRQLDDVVRRQDRSDKIRLRRGVNFIQMTLPFAQLHELLDALV